MDPDEEPSEEYYEDGEGDEVYEDEVNEEYADEENEEAPPPEDEYEEAEEPEEEEPSPPSEDDEGEKEEEEEPPEVDPEELMQQEIDANQQSLAGNTEQPYYNNQQYKALYNSEVDHQKQEEGAGQQDCCFQVEKAADFLYLLRDMF